MLQKLRAHVRSLFDAWQSYTLHASPERIWLRLFIPIVLLFVLFTPMGHGHDEVRHAMRISSLSSMQLVPEKLYDARFSSIYFAGEPSFGGKADNGLVMYMSRMANLPGEGHYMPIISIFNTPEMLELAQTGAATSFETHAFPNTAINSPVAYLPQLLVYVLLSLFHVPVWIVAFVLRLAGALCFAYMWQKAMKILPRGKWIMLALGLSPFVIFTTATISADSMTLGLGAVLISYSVRAMLTKDIQVVPLVACSALFMLCKTGYVALLALPASLLVGPRLCGRERKILLVGLIVAFTLFVGWSWCIKDIHTYVSFDLSDVHVNQTEQLNYIVSHPWQSLCVIAFAISKVSFGFASTGDFTYYESQFPTYITLALLLCCLLMEYKRLSPAKNPKLAHKRATLFIVVALITSALIALALYLQYSGVGSKAVLGMQERYFILCSLLLLLGLGELISCVKSTHEPTQLSVAQKNFTTTLLLITLISYILIYIPFFSFTVNTIDI